jgi:hypothetical protein
MAEAGRRTVIIRGQVVDRYSPRRSMVEVDPGERRVRADATASGHRARRPPAGRPQHAPRHDSRRSHSSRRHRGPYDQALARPDRIALWAVLLGVVLLLAAATSSHAAVLAHVIAR